MKKLTFLILILSIVVLSLSFGGGSAFADQTVTGTGKIDAITLLTQAGVDLLDAELPYLEGLGVEYDARIPASAVSIHSLGEGRVAVVASTYQRGDLTWIPSRVAVGEESAEFALVDHRYQVELSATEEDTLQVTYTADMVVGRAQLTTMANVAYTQAVAYNKQQTEWDRAYDDQLAAYQAYQDYLARKTAYERYKAYESDYREWQAAKARYDAYLVDMDNYNTALAAYLAYRAALEQYAEDLNAYQTYQTELAAYQANFDAYLEYVAKMERIERQLSLVQCIATYYTDLDRSVYDAVMGDSVTTVLREYEVLTSNAVGVDKAIINAARAATLKLREWFGAYFAYETDAEKYGYYAANYEVLITNWQTLLGALEALYNNKKVSYFIRQQDKERKYLILLAELAVIGNALNDQPQCNYDGNVSYLSDWKINKQTAVQILGGTIVEDRDDATPQDAVYPREVICPVEPTPVEQPVQPTSVQQPTSPFAVVDPGAAPEAVAQVGKPVEVAAVEEPTRQTLGDGEAALVALLTEGSLARRSIGEDLTVSLETTFGKQVVAEPVTVRFQVAGEEPLIVSTECGSFVEYTGEIPTKASDVSADYEFDYWMDEEGHPFSLDVVERDVTLTPHFRRITKSYTVTWVTPKGSTQLSQLYGSRVEAPADPTKEREGNYTFTFESWIGPNGAIWREGYVLLCDVTFEAAFVSHPVVEAEGSVSLEEDEERLIVDCTTASSVEVNIAKAAALAEDSYKALEVKLAGVTVAVSYRAACEMAAGEDSTLSWYSLARNKYCTEYRLDAGDYSGALTVTVNTNLPEGAKLYALGEDGTLAEVAYTRQEEGISFSANPGATYRFVVQYAINVLPAPLGITLTADHEVAYPEENIILSLDLPLGVRLGALKMSVDGEEREVGTRFVMPQGDVVLWVEATREVYTVTFLADGTVLEEVQAGYGEVVEAPVIPGKASDDFYTYESAGWDKEIAPVTGDAIYKARYTMTPVEQAPVEEGVYGAKFKLALGLGIAGIVLIVGAVVAVVTVVILKKKRAKARQ